MKKSPLTLTPVAPIIPIDQPAYYSIRNVMAITGWSHQTIYDRIKKGLFPPPIKLEKSRRIYWTTAVLRKELNL